MIFEDILMEEDVANAIDENLEVVLEVIPELKDMIGFDQKNPYHHLDVWDHTLYAMSLSPKDYEIRLALLLHDIGKPHCYQDEEVRHFKGHGLKSYEIAKKILERFDYSDEFKTSVCELILHHDDKMTEEYVNNNYAFAQKLYTIQYCDTYAHNPVNIMKRVNNLKDTKKLLKKRG